MPEGRTESGEPLHLIELEAPVDDQLLERFYSEVLQPSFDSSELVALADLRDGLHAESPTTNVVVALTGSGQIAGGAIADWDPASGVFLLSYLAARPGQRGQGIGGLLMGRVRSWWTQRDTVIALAEVDDPRDHVANQYGDPIARLRFYGRLGARVLRLHYTQPALQPETGRAPGMLLIAFYVAPEAGSTSSVRSDVLSTFLQGYYADAEGLTPAVAGKEVAQLFPELAAESIAILPLDQYVEF
jgi:GNAT superfamily N-acetyltransferase